MAVTDPRVIMKVLGGSILMGSIIYKVVDMTLTTQNISGGLWDLGKFMLSVIPVGFGVYYIFS